ncbi:cyanamide hydratase [Herbiconiux sp. CPCC 205763]|uniref:Cyanamide hydratase n=1 Tax=Herbiconiux aconitum TaxID=2970913 RepID=A0ABT2GRK8_9MICO|nr:cyanamide hydratase [Herbiconiux aconitum]MCS5718858.1 cyanamide hydratase [Herbiconiux aconitum]
MHLDELPLPDSAAATSAVEVAREYQSEALVNHCVRSYLWGAAQGRLTGLEFDDELLFVSAMLHDLALVPEFDNYTLPFENASGHVAWVFGAGAGWSKERRTRASEVIVRHMWDEVDPAVDPEGHLLCIGTGLDISGRHVELWPETLRTEVLERYPRLTLRDEFLRCFVDQADRKPVSSAADAIASGVAGRIDTNPLG